LRRDTSVFVTASFAFCQNQIYDSCLPQQTRVLDVLQFNLFLINHYSRDQTLGGRKRPMKMLQYRSLNWNLNIYRESRTYTYIDKLRNNNNIYTLKL